MPFDPVFPLLAVAIQVIVFLAVLLLVVRFVRAHERAAAALESIAGSLRRGGGGS